MRRISFAHTAPAIRAATKTVTRRRGWTFLKPGDLLQAVVSTRQRDTPENVLGVVRVEAVRREPLAAITAADVVLEGFPDLDPAGFVEMFVTTFGGGADDPVTRIEFSYASAPALNPEP